MQSNVLLRHSVTETFVPVRDSAAAEAALVQVYHDIEDVRAIWQGLAATNLESPGQDFAFTRQWIEAQGIARQDQYFVTVAWAGRIVALLPLHRRWSSGIRVLSWFPRAHVGCNAPLIDRQRLQALSPAEQRLMWQAMKRALSGADALVLRAIPATMGGESDPFAEFGEGIAVDTLYRSVFDSWEDADCVQRSRSRRKHDRQQGDRLASLGDVEFLEIGNGPEAEAVLTVMFRQRAARFAEMGVRDPFACPKTRSFYDRSVAASSGIAVKLHVLRLNGEIVAVRYSIALGDRLFCLISSMSVDESIQGGSPGKQCLLRVMQSIFGEGYRLFDMGAGFTDEKRHWCNEQVPLRNFYLPLTLRGMLASSLHRNWQSVRSRIKGDERLLGLVKTVRSKVFRGSAAPEPSSE